MIGRGKSLLIICFLLLSGSNVKSTLSILNCILARQLCFEDASCSAILEIIPRVCGPVPVACSTVTVTKCQAALKTLQAFQFFRPTCLCKEPGIDPDCNNFQNFLFDHPCGFVLRKEKDPYPVDALPTCNHALSVCQQERKCIKLFENFKTHCKVRDNKCRMDDRNLCHEAWTNLRLSPMFGCICPANHMKRRCDRIFAMVNHNPCVVQTMSVDDSYRYDLNMALVEMPLMNAPVSTHYEQLKHHRHGHHNVPHPYPYNLSAIVTAMHHHHNGVGGSHIAGQSYASAASSSSSPSSSSEGDPAGSAHMDNIIFETGRQAATSGSGQTALSSSSSSSSSEQQQSAAEQTPDSHTEIVRIHFQSTCHTALEACREDQSCAGAVQPVLQHCDLRRCNRNACMDALKAFYRGAHEALSLDVAFCLCKKTSERPDICMSAQEKLHPVCAQRPPDMSAGSTSAAAASSSSSSLYPALPACHVIAEFCKEDTECRARLEHYEQACAVDSVTLKCAGRSSVCRTAMLGILGTPLRTTCTCQGAESQQLYECLGWHRLLWLNPCIVESQRDFHMKRLADLGLLETTTVTMPPTTTTTIATSTTVAMTTSRPRTTRAPVLAATSTTMTPMSAETKPKTVEHYSGNGALGNGRKKHQQQQVTKAYPNRQRNGADMMGGGGRRGGKHHGDNDNDDGAASNGAGRAAKNDDDDIDDEDLDIDDDDDDAVDESDDDGDGGGGGSLKHVPTIEDATTNPPTTTTTTMASTVPPRFCVVQRPQQSDQLIPESSTRRIYSLDDSECSELCSCTDTLTLSCHALCVPFLPCRTSLAFYSHASPAYQAFRGRCLCYSGRFICMRPAPGEYVLPGGVFLMLGYSSTDEALLRPYTNLGVQDSIRGLQHYVTRHIANQTSCSLALFNMTDENIIISARLPHDAKVIPMELLRREKAQCTGILEVISRQVNNQHSELAAHRLLSIFKMAEVQVVWPEVNSGAGRSLRHGTWPIFGSSLAIIVALLSVEMCRWRTLWLSIDGGRVP